MNKMNFLVTIAAITFLCGCSLVTSNKETNLEATNDKKESASLVVNIDSAESFEKEVLKADKPVIADFSAQWCHACQTMKPVFEELAKEMLSYKFVSINVDAVEKIARDYNVTGIPTFAFFKDGRELNSSNRIVGAVSKDEFTTMLAKAFDAPAK